MAKTDLTGRRVLAIVSNYGVEQDELAVPVKRLRDDGAEVTIAAVSDEPIRTLKRDKEPGVVVTPDATLADVDPDDHDMLLVPGGALNADKLRLNDDAVQITQSFATSGRPVASICHGPWLLVEAGVLGGKTLTSYPSLQTDIRNAGAASWKDKTEITDDANGYTLVTSRGPKDLDSFVNAIEQALTA